MYDRRRLGFCLLDVSGIATHVRTTYFLMDGETLHAYEPEQLAHVQRALQSHGDTASGSAKQFFSNLK